MELKSYKGTFNNKFKREYNKINLVNKRGS